MEANELNDARRAIDLFEKALSQSPSRWIAIEGLARCYGDNLNEYDTAIRFMEDAKNAWLISSRKVRSGNCDTAALRDLSRLHKMPSRVARSSHLATAKSIDSILIHAIHAYVDALYRSSLFGKITGLIRELDTIETSQYAVSLLTMFIRDQWNVNSQLDDFFDKMEEIVRVLDDDVFEIFFATSLLKAVSLTPENISEPSSGWLACTSGWWRYRHFPDPRESVAIWEKIVDLVNQGTDAR